MKKKVYLLFMVLAVSCEEAIERDPLSEGFPKLEWTLIAEVRGSNLGTVLCLESDRNGGIWIGTRDSGLIHYNVDTAHYNSQNSSLTGNSITALALDNNNDLWGATENEIFKLYQGEFTIFNSTNSPLVVDYIRQIKIDQANNVWIADGNSLRGGLTKFNQNTQEWYTYTPQNSLLPTRIVNSILVGDDNSIWTGHGQYQGLGGIWNLSQAGAERLFTTSNSQLIYNHISDLSKDCNSNIWICSDASIYLSSNSNAQEGGIQELRGEKLFSRNPASSGKLSNRVNNIAVDPTGLVWATTQIDGVGSTVFDYQIAIFNGTKWRTLSELTTELPRTFISDILIDNNHVWLAAPDLGGIVKIQYQYD